MNWKTTSDRLKFYFVLQRLDPEIQRIIDIDNLRYCRVMSFCVVFLELIMLIFYGFFSDPSFKWYWLRIWCYSSYLLLSAVSFFFFTRMIRQVTNHRLLMIVGLFYCAAAIVWGMVISATDYILGNQLFVFITNVICVAGLALIRPMISIPFFTSLFAIFYCILIFFCGADRSLPTNYLILLLMVLLINIIRYHTKLSDATTRVEYEKLNQKLNWMSRHDELTLLKNRHSLSMDTPSFFGKPLFLMLLDVDDFKAMNDSKGHDYGDGLLRMFAGQLQTRFLPQNVYRFGGDEFLIAVPEPDRTNLVKNIERCGSASELLCKAQNPDLTCSGGYVVRTPKNIQEFDDMIHAADSALYQSKRNGKNTILRAEEANPGR
ncbi:MAG: GGDEF domain-containing protein [Eubacteriales bacterium]|nr:GGDEF domain-containing protein [Eubacteriales bacterium]